MWSKFLFFLKSLLSLSMLLLNLFFYCICLMMVFFMFCPEYSHSAFIRLHPTIDEVVKSSEFIGYFMPADNYFQTSIFFIILLLIFLVLCLMSRLMSWSLLICLKTWVVGHFVQVQVILYSNNGTILNLFIAEVSSSMSMEEKLAIFQSMADKVYSEMGNGAMMNADFSSVSSLMANLNSVAEIESFLSMYFHSLPVESLGVLGMLMYWLNAILYSPFNAGTGLFSISVLSFDGTPMAKVASILNAWDLLGGFLVMCTWAITSSLIETHILHLSRDVALAYTPHPSTSYTVCTMVFKICKYFWQVSSKNPKKSENSESSEKLDENEVGFEDMVDSL